MDDFRMAVLSDIHGNRWALEAVLADIKRRGIREIVNLGDSLYGPLDPKGTAEILMGLGLPTVRGNEDRILVEASKNSGESATFRLVLDSLSGDIFRWLNSQLLTMAFRDQFFLCHGTPFCDSEYLLLEVRKEGVSLRKREDLMARTAAVNQPVILCGHDHLSHIISLSGEKLIVNPGSVGLPAYSDDDPHPHRMETGTPHARYAVVSRIESGWLAEDIAVPYPWEIAASVAGENGRPDWARWLISGRADVL